MPSQKNKIKFLILVIALFLIWLLGRYFNLDIQAIRKSLEGYPLIYSAVIYIILYVVISFFVFFSKDLFWLMGAILYGAALSTLFICIAETINACILFYLARSLGRNYVWKTLTGKYKNFDEKLSNIGFFWVLVFRAAPLIPYRILDLAAGLTNIKFRKYLLAVILGSPVKMFWIQYILTAVGANFFKNPSLTISYFTQNPALLIFSFIYIILIITVIIKIKKLADSA
jgi:uncharacterized membrane protein YdjX (TVP38/TMEM64 family)